MATATAAKDRSERDGMLACLAAEARAMSPRSALRDVLPDLPPLSTPVSDPVAKWEDVARLSHQDPSLHQVYLRYNGPKDGDAHFPASSWPKP